MKILCVCDFGIDQKVMSKMEELKKYNAEIFYLYDERLQSAKTITEFVLRAEQHGADACEPYQALVDSVRDVDILVTHISPVTTQIIEAADKLKYVCVLRGSHTNVNTELCTEKGVKVIEAPGRNANGVADCAVGLMLAEMRNIARGHHYLMQGDWKKKFVNLLYTRDMQRCTVGIIGTGFIGQKVIKRLSGFECKVIGYDPYMSKENIEKLGIAAVSLDELLESSDIISIHLRLSESTEGFIGRKQFERMKPTAYFINTARAGLVDEQALVEALRQRKIGGAALDVFSEEPLGKDSPYLSLDNVTITPHVAGTTMDSFSNAVEIVTHALSEMFLGNKIPGIVNETINK